MNLHLFEDTLTAGQVIVLPDTTARALYVAAGQVSCNSQTYDGDEGFVANDAVTVTAGPGGATLWRWDLADADPRTQTHRTVTKLSGAIPDALAGPDNFLRLDSVAFPPDGTALLHTHQGPGIRCLREGSIRIDTDGTSTSYGPGGAWFEAGPDPVFAQADRHIPSRFIRAMVLPMALSGKSSIHYENEEDRAKPKSQSYHRFGEIGLRP